MNPLVLCHIPFLGSSFRFNLWKTSEIEMTTLMFNADKALDPL